MYKHWLCFITYTFKGLRIFKNLYLCNDEVLSRANRRRQPRVDKLHLSTCFSRAEHFHLIGKFYLTLLEKLADTWWTELKNIGACQVMSWAHAWNHSNTRMKWIESWKIEKRCSFVIGLRGKQRKFMLKTFAADKTTTGTRNTLCTPKLLLFDREKAFCES